MNVALHGLLAVAFSINVIGFVGLEKLVWVGSVFKTEPNLVLTTEYATVAYIPIKIDFRWGDALYVALRDPKVIEHPFCPWLAEHNRHATACAGRYHDRFVDNIGRIGEFGNVWKVSPEINCSAEFADDGRSFPVVPDGIVVLPVEVAQFVMGISGLGASTKRWGDSTSIRA